MPKHAAPRTRSPFWSTLAASTAVAAIVSGTVSSVPLAHSEPQPAAKASETIAVHGGNPTIGVCETDSDCAQLAYDQGLPIEGYGVDVSKVYDFSKPYGWAARDNAYVGYCGDAALAEHEYVDDATDLAVGKRCAAEMILLRAMSGQQLYEDWTWQGMPPVVDEFHDALIADWQANGMPSDTNGWLAGIAAPQA